jgi:hypothetical protein
MGKVAYRVRNWREYNRALIDRGNLTVWIGDNLEETWYSDSRHAGRGRSDTYSDSCIQLMLIIRSLFHLPLRATQGFFEGFFTLLNIELKTPHYSRLSRRASGLVVNYTSQKARRKPRDLVVDSTGLKIYGEGEWKMRTHGKDKRRTWRKLHVAVDPNSFETISIEVTDCGTHDDEVMAPLLDGLKNLGKVYADGAYISSTCFGAIAAGGGEPLIALRTGTGLVKKDPTPGQQLRNDLVKGIWQAGGRGAWKKNSGYHRRSLVETHMYRFKTILGPRLSNRVFRNQVCEAKVKTLILNRMTTLGMPVSVKVD